MPKVITEELRANMRRQIFQAAAEEFSRVGFDQARMDTISELAGVGKGTVYLYFKSKEILFSEMLAEIVREQLAQIRAALTTKSGIDAQLDTLLATYFRLVVEQPDNSRIFISSLYGVNRRFKQEAAMHSQEFLKLIEGLLEEAYQQGEIVASPEPAALLVLNAAQFLVLTAESHGFDPEFIHRQRQTVVRLLLQGLRSAG